MASKRGKLITLPEKMNMVNMIRWLQEKAAKNIFRSELRMTDTAAREEVADALGYSMSSVKRAHADWLEFGELEASDARASHSGNREFMVDDPFVLNRIRKHIQDENLAGRGVTSHEIHDLINAGRGKEEAISYSTTKRLLRRMGFRYRKGDRKHPLRESNDTQVLRARFLREIHRLRLQQRTEVYLDETAIHQHERRKYSRFTGKDNE